ncbi:phosphatidate cytidylyltransferase [Flavobacteriales bacterium]|nr:phosphatidate cytidylyltransferase [Flavobacteriales bacterium]
MNNTLTRALSGSIYIAIMWFATSYSKTSLTILFLIILFICLYEMYKLRKGKTKTLAFLSILSPFLLVHLIATKLVLFMFILTWTFDTFAYLVGVRFGKHKIIPTISPNKSWEGFAGGFILTIITAYLAVNYFLEIGLTQIIAISLLVPFTATIGDFIESYYKRESGVKDSGSLIPGHGGMLDRMDAFIITIPVIYILTKIL